MIIALKISKADQEQAARLFPLFPDEETVLLAIEEGANVPYQNEGWKVLPWTDPYNSFPQSDNHVFQQIALYCKEILKSPFLYMTAQSVPTRPSWFREINEAYAEAIKKRKPFMGDLVRDEALRVNIMSPVAVYPPNISQLAGEIMLAHDNHWSMEGGVQIGAWFQKTTLIRNIPNGLNKQTAGDAALVAPDRDGKFFTSIYKFRTAEQIENPPEIFRPGTSKVPLERIAVVPWEDIEESHAEIKRLIKVLRTFQTNPAATHRVRLELAMYGVTPGDSKIKKMQIRRLGLGD